jgi:hypothetical protein
VEKVIMETREKKVAGDDDNSCGCTQIIGRRWSEISGTADQQYTHETGQ